MFSARWQSTHTASAAYSRVLLLVSRDPIVHSYGRLPWIERQAESCWMSRCKNTFNAVHMQSILLETRPPGRIGILGCLRICSSQEWGHVSVRKVLQHLESSHITEGWVFIKDVALSKPFTWVKLQSSLRKRQLKCRKNRNLVQLVIIAHYYNKHSKVGPHIHIKSA